MRLKKSLIKLYLLSSLALGASFFLGYDLLTDHNLKFKTQISDKQFLVDLTNRFIKKEATKMVYPYNSFFDTEKPNAIVTLPSEDHNAAFQSFAEVEFNYYLDKYYDVNRKVINSKSELKTLIDETPNVELLIIGGHGDGFSIDFGIDTVKYNLESALYDLSRYDPDTISVENKILLDSFQSVQLNKLYNIISESLLTYQDVEFKNYFQKLDSNAVIYINTCLGAKYNFADSIKSWAGESRTVFASKESYASLDRRVLTYYPLDLKIELNRLMPDSSIDYVGNVLYGLNDVTWKK